MQEKFPETMKTEEVSTHRGWVETMKQEEKSHGRDWISTLEFWGK